MKNSLLESPKRANAEGKVYKSEAKAPLLHRAKNIGRTAMNGILNFVAPKWGPEAEAAGLAENNKHMIDKHLAPLRETYDRRAAVLQTYTEAVNQALPGERPANHTEQRLVTGEYIPQNGDESARVQVTVFDQPRRGATKTQENGKGVILTRAAAFEDGTHGYRRETYSPGINDELRVQTTDYKIGADGNTVVQEHSAGWATDRIGGAEATIEQANFIQEVVFTGDTNWDQPTVRAIPQQ